MSCERSCYNQLLTDFMQFYCAFLKGESIHKGKETPIILRVILEYLNLALAIFKIKVDLKNSE